MAVLGSILTAITAVAEAAAAFYRVQQVSAAYDLTERIEKDITDDENEISRLRAHLNTGSQLAADRLQKRLVRRQGWLAHIPAPGAIPESGTADPDEGRDLHPSV